MPPALRRVGLLTAVLAAGCSSRGPKLYPVTGTVQVDGQPADQAIVVFHPVAPADKDAPRPMAVAGKDGMFVLSTYAANDGAPSGDYKLTVVWPPPVPPSENKPDIDLRKDRLKNAYADPAAPAAPRVTVEPKSNTIPVNLSAPPAPKR